MSERKSFLVRLDPELLAALQRWAAADLRSLNGQIEFLLRQALRDAGRAPAPATRRAQGSAEGEPGDDPARPSGHPTAVVPKRRDDG
jgi:hypothetical protein